MADHAAETLVKEPGLRVVLIALRAQGRMHEHRAHAPITVQVLKGRVHFRVEERAFELAAGRLLAVAADMAHDVEALEESAMLLTIGGAID